MLWLRACPRCHGDLFVDSDYHGLFASCIQCGAYLDQPRQTLSGQRLVGSAVADRLSQTTVAPKTGRRRVA